MEELEHGVVGAQDRWPDKKTDGCQGQKVGMKELADIETNGEQFKSLVADLIAHHVAVTSTLTVFETFTPGTPEPPGLDVLDPILQQDFQKFRANVNSRKESDYVGLVARGRAMDRRFAHAGGLLLAGAAPPGVCSGLAVLPVVARVPLGLFGSPAAASYPRLGGRPVGGCG